MWFVNEKINPEPVSAYGNSKLTAEKMLEVLYEQYQIPVINLRLFNVYGPGQNLNNLEQGMVSIYLYYQQLFDNQKGILMHSNY